MSSQKPWKANEELVFSRGVAWIALNDAPADKASREELEGYLTVCLLADLLDISPTRVAQCIVSKRKASARNEKLTAKRGPEFKMPAKGDGVTQIVGSDCYPFTVSRVHPDGMRCWVKADDFKRTDTNGFSETQTYEYTQNPNAEEIALRWTGKRWQNVAGARWTPYRIGERKAYTDPSF